MRYARLTKEQFEELHPEFTRFLAAQSIDRQEWETIKLETPHVAEQELDVFSDLVWEGVLSRAEYLEHYSSTHVFLFACDAEVIRSIVLKSLDETIDLLSPTGLDWLNANLFGESVEIKAGKRAYQGERNGAIFSLIQQGAILSDGKLFSQLESVING